MMQFPSGFPWDQHVPFKVLVRRVLGNVLSESTREELALTDVLLLKDILILRDHAGAVHAAWIELVAGQREARLQQLAQTRVSRRATAQTVTQSAARIDQLAAPPAVLDHGAAAAAAAAAAPVALDADDDADDEGESDMRDMILAAQQANKE